MLYDAYEVQRSLLGGASRLAGMSAGWLNNPANPLSYSSMGPVVAASLDVFAHAAAVRGHPEFGLKTTQVGRKTAAVREETVLPVVPDGIPVVLPDRDVVVLRAPLCCDAA